MKPELSPNTTAILLLTAPLILGRTALSADILSLGEYNRLAAHLRKQNRQPADLLGDDSPGILHGFDGSDPQRIHRLTERGFQLSQVVDRWASRGIWVVSRADSEYPQRLKGGLSEAAPPVLYGCGDPSLLDAGGLAIVGSRDAGEELHEYTRDVARVAARAHVPVVSGGARGIDQAAMQGALACGGPVTAVLADSLERSTLDREHRRLLLDGQLTLVSPFDPNAGFNVGNAMQRNKMVYALADAALVVNSDVGKGGTWAGAVEQLTKLRLVPLFVRSTGAPSPGLQALMGKGALPWPNPRDDAELRTLLRARSTQPESPPAIQAPFPLASEAAKATTEDDLYGAMLRRLQELFLAPKKESEVAAALGIEKKRLRAVLERLVQEGALMRSSKTRAFVYKGPMLFPDVKPATVPDPV